MTSESWYELLDKLLAREGLSRPQVERRSGVSSRTLASWLRGEVKKPRDWQPLAKVLNALNPSAAEVNEVLQAAGFGSVSQLAASAPADKKVLLFRWLRPDVPFMAPGRLVGAFIGRESELEKARQALRHGRCCAIWGMGGVGKTSLTIELAHQLRDDYPDGVFWGDMSLSPPDAILESWGQACAMDLWRLPDFSSRAVRMRTFFSQKTALIILDDVVDSQQALQMMPSGSSQSAVLVTTRSEDVAQAVAHRQKFQIVTLRPLPREQSFALFAEVLSSDVLQAEQTAANEVAEMMGDLPLALQICAALCADGELALSEMVGLLRALDTRLEHLRLEQGPTVRLAFEQSWELIGDELRRAFATLGVFEGRPFTALAFAACAHVHEGVAKFLLSRLRRRSLLNNHPHGRYQQHVLLAAFALEKLKGDVGTQHRFARYYLDYVQGELTAKRPVLDEWGNVMVGMRTAHQLADHALVLEYYEVLHDVWRRQGLYSLAREGCAWAAQAAEVTGNKAKQAEILLNGGVACLEQADYRPARELLQQALELFTDVGNSGRMGDVHYYLSRIEAAQDDFDVAEQQVRRAWGLYQQVDDPQGLGRAIYRMGNIYYHRGHYAEAIGLANDAIGSQDKVEDVPGRLRSHMLAVSAHLQLGEIEAAEEHCRQARLLAEGLDDRGETAVFYYTYADLCRFQGRFMQARDYALRALGHFEEMYDMFSVANTLNLLAGIEVYWNDAQPERQVFETGLLHCQKGIEICNSLDYSLGQAFLLLNRGRLQVQHGDTAAACTDFHAAHHYADSLQHQWLLNRLQTLLADVGCIS